MSARRIVACVGVVLCVLAVASMGDASPWNKATYFTFSKPVRLPGVTLPAGTYVFELPSSDVKNLVRVSSRNGSNVHLTAFTHIVTRPTSKSLKSAIVLGEGPATAPPPIKIWYPEGDPNGRQFIY